MLSRHLLAQNCSRTAGVQRRAISGTSYGRRRRQCGMMPSGYHPSIAVPEHRIGFLRTITAHREVVDRQFVVLNIQPGFEQVSSGLEAGHK